MSDLAPQKINLSFGGLLQVPGGLTSSLQSITDGNGVSSAVQISTTGVSAPIISDTVTITGGTINGTTIGALNPASGSFTTLKVDTLSAMLKASSGIVSAATAGTDYLAPPSGTSILKANSGGALANAVSGTDYAPATSGSAILKGNGAGGFASAVANTDYQGVISATGILKGAGSGSISSATAGVDYSAGTSALATGILKSTTSTGALSIAVSGTDYAPATSGTSILKGNGSGGFSNASSGTDYAPATSGTSILYGNGSGGFSNVTVGSGLQFTGGTLASTSAGGSVTTVSVVSANGFAGTVANASSTPAITLSTSITGLLKGNGTAISAATAGTDYTTPTGTENLSNKTITSSSLNSSPIGASSASTGAFTDLSYTGTLTGSTGILNIGSGQIYKDASGNVGIGTSSPGAKLNIVAATSSDALRITQTGAGNALLVEDSANPDATPFVVDAGGNVVIGNTAIVAGVVTGSLQTQGSGVNGSSYNIQAYSLSTGGTIEFDRSRGGLGAQSIVSSGDRLGRIFFCGSDGSTFIRGAEIYAAVDGTPGTNNMPGRLVFSTTADGASSPTERVRIDSSGNLGLGVTPSGWGSAGNIDLPNAGSLVTQGPLANLGSNWYYNAGYKYKTSAPAAQYGQNSGSHIWYTAPSGTAGNAISFTQAMTLDASGNLGIGTSSPSYKLQVNGASTGDLVQFTDGTYQSLRFGTSTTGAYYNNPNGGYQAWQLSGSEKMRIDSSGNLLVGQTASGLQNSTSFAAGPSAAGFVANHASGVASGTTYGVFGYNAVQIGSITQNGTTGVLYNTTSDQRLKTNVVPAGSAIQSILDFPVDQFDWIADGSHQDFGAVAQKAINHIPEMVSVPADEDEMWGIDWSKAVPRLIKTIQELSAELNELKQRIN